MKVIQQQYRIQYLNQWAIMSKIFILVFPRTNLSCLIVLVIKIHHPIKKTPYHRQRY
jgi:hypothetical protein